MARRDQGEVEPRPVEWREGDSVEWKGSRWIASGVSWKRRGAGGEGRKKDERGGNEGREEEGGGRKEGRVKEGEGRQEGEESGEGKREKRVSGELGHATPGVGRRYLKLSSCGREGGAWLRGVGSGVMQVRRKGGKGRRVGIGAGVKTGRKRISKGDARGGGGKGGMRRVERRKERGGKAKYEEGGEEERLKKGEEGGGRRRRRGREMSKRRCG